jgi:hypothetical protein
MKSEEVFVFVGFSGRNFTFGYLAEETVFTHYSSIVD